ncbi:hypothetical protein M9H77_13041 [Catharanthus roseus]|uniref:Uncharacterized protein n=1 Tax=Catharanthus roseus TaxID=4058 RepID=A0ACC0BJ72_CATRO|nr:hypothetical protein M9H77_13041 [Catharanthus roseus]
MQGHNTVEEVLCLSVQWGYTVFYRNCDKSNIPSDIVFAYPTSIQMMRTWPYVLIMNMTYNMLLLEAVGMTPTNKNFTVATVFMRNKKAITYRWVLEQIKHLYFASAMSIGSEEDEHFRRWAKILGHFPPTRRKFS